MATPIRTCCSNSLRRARVQVFPIFVLTLHHLSFEDHLAGTSSVQRREWAKVQGRFEDIAFVESASQTRALIGTVFDLHNDSLRARIKRWADSEAKAMRELGIADLADPLTVASCYPLHPLAALVLPELCNRHGQHERTLFSFLTSQHRASASSFLNQTDVPARGPLPTIGLDAVYDYFVDGSALQIESTGVSGRWTEIATRLRDAHGLTPPQGRLAKAIALLNLVATTGTFRASAAILARTSKSTEQTLTELERASVVTYRDFADEYRIWQGTDVDINLLLDSARQRVGQRPLSEILSEIDQPRPVVAAQHSAKHDVLRVFSRRYANSSDPVDPFNAFSRFDGEVLLLVDSKGDVPTITRPWAGAKPIVAAIPGDVSALDTAAREVAAVHVALDEPSVTDDWVARRELSERMAQTRAALDRGARGCLQLRFVPLGASRARGARTPGWTGQRRPVRRRRRRLPLHAAGAQRDAQPRRTHLSGRKGTQPAPQGDDRAWQRAQPGHAGLWARGCHVPGFSRAHRTPRTG